MTKSVKTYLRVGLAVAVVLVAAAAITACGSSSTGSSASSTTSAKTSINLMVAEYSDTTKGEWQQIIKDFEAANPTITVNLSVVSWTNIYDVVTTNIQSGTPPDILNLDAYSPYAASGLLYPAKDIVSPAVLSDFERPFAEESTINGTQWALPFIASARALFYNKTIFAKAGLSAPPKTWAELEADAKAIKAAGYIGYGMPLGNEEAQAEGAYWFYGAGGGYGTATSKITIDTPQNIAGATEMQKLINAGLTEPNAGATNRDPLLNVFMAGKIGMEVGLPQTVVQIKQKNPSLSYGVAAIPTENGSPFTLGVEDHMMAFKSKVDKTAAIKKFLDYFYTGNVYTTWVADEGFLPVTTTGATAMASNTELKPFLAALPYAVFYPGTNPKWATAQAALLSQLGLLASPQTNPSALLKAIQAKVDK